MIVRVPINSLHQQYDKRIADVLFTYINTQDAKKYTIPGEAITDFSLLKGFLEYDDNVATPKPVKETTPGFSCCQGD